MPTYQVTAPDGRKLRLTGDSPPTKEAMDDIFQKVAGTASARGDSRPTMSFDDIINPPSETDNLVQAGKNFYAEKSAIDSMPQPELHGELRATPKWEVIKHKLSSVFGDRSKAGPSTLQTVGASSMLLPFGLPERLGKLLLGYFTVKTAADQPAIAGQIKQEIAHKEYTDAARDTVGDVLQLGMIGAGLKSLRTATGEPSESSPETATGKNQSSQPASETAAPSKPVASSEGGKFVPPAVETKEALPDESGAIGTSRPTLSADELKRAMEFNPVKYSPSDEARYNELVTRMKGATLDEAQPMAMELNALKNRYGGQAPVVKAETDLTTKTPRAQSAAQFSFDTSVQDAHTHWSNLTAAADAVEEANNSKISKLEEQYKATKKRDEKKAVREQIETAQGEISDARAASEHAMRATADQFNPQIETRAKAAGVPDEKMDDFKSEFWDTVFERPGVEWSWDKNFDDVFKAVAEPGVSVAEAAKKAAPALSVEELAAPVATKTAKTGQVIVPAERLDDKLWTGKQGDIDKSFSVIGEKKKGVSAFTHEGKLYTVTGRVHLPYEMTAQAHELISPEDYKGPKAGEVSRSNEGAAVTYRGKPYVLGPKTEFVSADRPIADWQKHFRAMYEKGGYFTSGKTYHEVLNDFASKEHWDGKTQKYVPVETVAPNYVKAITAELQQPDFTKHFETSQPSESFKEFPQPTEVKVAEKKIEQQVKTVAATEGQRPAKEVKSELVDRLEKAIASAPAEADALSAKDLADYNDTKERFRNATESKNRDTAKAALDAYKKQLGQVTIDIPGDGTFTVVNTKEALSDVLVRAKRISTSSTEPVATTRTGISKEDRDWIAANKQTVSAIETQRTPSKEPEKIKSAAIRSADGTIYTGAWHPAAYEQYMADKGVSKAQAISEQQSGKIQDGFLTSSGRFVDRDEAATIASKASQFKPDKEGDVAFAGALKGLDRESKIIKPGRVAAMGGSAPRSAARVAAEASAKASRTQEQARIEGAGAAVKSLKTAAEDVMNEDDGGAIGTSRPTTDAKWFLGLRKAFNPTSLGDAAKFTGTVLRKMLGDRYQAAVRFDAANAKFRSAFDKRTTPRNFIYDADKPLPPNWELQRAIDTGDMENLTPLEKDFATTWNKFISSSVEGVRKLKPDVLQDLHEFYFARYWRAEDEGAARALAQQHRPWQGTKGFMKSRSLALWEDALKRGLRPRYDNPADAAAAKLSEIEMFRSALEAHNILKGAGVRRFVYIFERGPDQWVEAPANDPSSKVYGPPTVTIKEAYDEQIRVKTLEMFKSLGIDQKRLANIGGKRWGYAREARAGDSAPPAARGEEVVTKFGGADFVFWHEFGHIMDYRYPDLRPNLGMTKGGRGGAVTDNELRALADLRFEGDAMKAYRRKSEEKMANVFDAYVRAPELFKQTAPTVYNNLLRWLELHPEVKGPLNDIRPSLKLGGGETEQFVGGPVLLGRWMMPPDAAQVLNNYLSKGYLSGVKSLRGIKTLGGLISNVRLISAFHGQMVGNDALASGLSLPLYDAMKAVADRNPALLKRGAKDLLLAPARPFLALRQGSQMLKAVRNPNADVSDLSKQLAQYAVDANLRAGHFNTADNASRRWKQNLAETINAIKGTARGDARPTDVLPPAFDLFLHTPLAISHEMMRPIMEWFVPRMKMGLAAPMIQRVIADNPGMDPWEIRAKLGKVGDAVEDRVGQVTYDNLFQSRAVKDSGQLALQAYGWHLTKERLLWGGASDYFKAGKAMLTGKKPDITFRMTYLPSLVMTHAIIGGTLMYALTGRRPKHLIDYLFPETGLVDAYGRPVRMALADFLKDYLGEWNAAMHGPKAVVQEWERRLMPVWNELADMYRNKDFWNTKIFSERQFDEPEYQHVWTNLKEGVNYLAGSSAPFSVKGAQRFQQSLGSNPSDAQKALAMVGPFLGFVPAPLALTQSPAEARAAEIMRDSLPPMTKDQAAHSKLVSDLVHDLRTGKLNDEGQLVGRVRAAGVKDQAELTRIQQRVLWTPLQYQIHRLPLLVPGSGADAMSVWDLMSDKEKVQTAPVFMDKVQRAYEGGRLDTATTSRLVKVVMPFLKVAMQQRANSTTKTPSAQRSALYQ